MVIVGEKEWDTESSGSFDEGEMAMVGKKEGAQESLGQDEGIRRI